MTATVDELLALVLSSTSRDDLSKRVLPALKQANQALSMPTSDGKDPLGVLDPVQNSLGFLFYVTQRCDVDRPDVPLLYHYVTSFIRGFDPEQVKLAPERFNCIADSLSRLASAAGKSVLAIAPMRIAIERFALGPGYLTGLHKFFVKECLSTKHYKEALPILSNPITEVHPQIYGINILDHLLYHYYGGMIYIGLKRYTDALDFFSLVISAPANVPSQIQIEAYKKFVLVSLLVKGKVEQLPKYTSPVVIKACKNACINYTGFASAWESLNITRVQNGYNKVAEIVEGFNKDKNLGLVKQCMQALYRRQIQQLTQTYLTLSLADIARSIGIEGPEGARTVESYIVKMIEDGEIHATIAHAHPSGGGMVSFHDNPDRYNTDATLRLLDSRIAATIQTSERVVALDRTIGMSKEYLSKAIGFSHGGGYGSFSGGGFPADGDDFGYDGVMEDKFFS